MVIHQATRASRVLPGRTGLTAASLGREALLIVGGSAVLALSAQAAVWLPILSPVPMTAQTLACLLLAALLGARRGTACVAAYLVEGACGLPVFAAGGAGVLHLLGPTGGYLVGFLAAAWLVGSLADRNLDRRFGAALASMAAGTVVIFACGLSWLWVYVGPELVVAAGLTPFLPGAMVKIILGAVLLPMCRRVLARETHAGSIS